MKSYVVHYKNKYPGAKVISSEDALDVFCADDRHRVALRKNGAGQFVCVSEEMGCDDSHDLAPIPKNARVHKLYKDGKIALSEEHAVRKEVAAKLATDGKIPSIAECQAAGLSVDDKGHVTLK